jgi:serine/threonine protein kinase
VVKPGTILLGKYRVEQILGKGGMGVVARAYHLQLDVPVAIKFLLPEVLEAQNVVTRFLREAQAAVKLKSEHVSRIIDVGTLENGAPYMVMEYLDGTDLGEFLREHGPLPPSFTVDLILHACEALAEAHALGIIHRDIKSSNLFLTQRTGGAPLLKVLDFGISKAPLTVDDAITQSQLIMGTPAYMSPEQMRSSKHVDARTDIWALGVVIYELVSGRRPFRAESFAELVMLVATQPAPPLGEVTLPPGLKGVILRCLEKDPSHRFQNIAELAAALAPHASTPIQAASSIERIARVLGLATIAAASSCSPDRAIETATYPPSTLSESMGEQVAAQTAALFRPTSRKVAAGVVPPPMRDPLTPVGKPWYRRRALLLTASATLLGAIVAAVVTVRVEAEKPVQRSFASANAVPDATDATKHPVLVAIQSIMTLGTGLPLGNAASVPGDSTRPTDTSAPNAMQEIGSTDGQILDSARVPGEDTHSARRSEQPAEDLRQQRGGQTSTAGTTDGTAKRKARNTKVKHAPRTEEVPDPKNKVADVFDTPR